MNQSNIQFVLLQVYEREAIEDYMKTTKGRHIISPFTGQKMGKTLIAAIQTKNTMETLIDNNIIVGELAIDWKKRSHEINHIKDFVQKAERGDTSMMLNIGSWLMVREWR